MPVEMKERNSMGERLAHWTTTTRIESWLHQQDLPVGTLSAAPDVVVDTSSPKQRIEGFGASFNELGWAALTALTHEQRQSVLRALFARDVGTSLSLCRMPIGANDFSHDWYSYDETPGDLALEHFSVEQDDQTLVPFIQAAQSHRPDLRVWASPWSPPTWMKTNRHYAAAAPIPGYQPENGIRPDQVRSEGDDMMRQDPDYLEAYARYFGRFVDAYRERGIPIGMVMPQNEFNSPQVFPSCTWSPQGLARFLPFLAAEMRKRDVEVFLGTLERSADALAEHVLSAVPDVIDGVGAQWAGKNAVPFIHHAHPDLRIYQTEQECGDGHNDWRYARYAWTLMRHFFQHGAGAYMYWNIALTAGGVSRWGWAQNSLITVDTETRTFKYNYEYYLLRHLSGFVHEGARYLSTASFTGFENQLAFLNPDDSIVIVVHNDNLDAQSVRYHVDGSEIQVSLPGDSFSTIVIPAV
jgi:glucosylceramidase